MATRKAAHPPSNQAFPGSATRHLLQGMHGGRGGRIGIRRDLLLEPGRDWSRDWRERDRWISRNGKLTCKQFGNVYGIFVGMYMGLYGNIWEFVHGICNEEPKNH